MDLFLSKFEAPSITASSSRLRPGHIGLMGAVCWFLLAGVSVAQVQRPFVQAPEGTFLQVGPAIGGGTGIMAGIVSAHTLYSSELHAVANLEPLIGSDDQQYRVAVLMGASLRLFGIERLIGNAGYRGLDVDIGLRAGPAISFSSDESRITRNQRFALILEPVVRAGKAFPSGSIVFLELGTARPWLRAGLWLGL